MPRPLIPAAALTVLLAGAAGAGERTLHNFIGGKQGAFPGALIAGPDGTLYGMTQPFSNGQGAVFAIVPPKKGGDDWTILVLHRFTGGADGEGGDGRLLLDRRGRLFGLTANGGASGGGSAFMLTPGRSGALPWAKTELAAFGRGNGAGAFPAGGLTQGAGGELYGVTLYGGDGPCPVGCGTVFRLDPSSDAGGPWRKTVLYEFQGRDDGAAPPGPVIQAADGALIGTAAMGGRGVCEFGCGTVWRLAPAARDAGWRLTPLHDFSGAEGAGPLGAPLAEDDGSLIVNLPFLGRYDHGAVVRVSPPAAPGGPWLSVVLHAFRGEPDGAAPIGNPVRSAQGVLYGTTEFGGIEEQGTIFSLAPPPPWGDRWQETVLHHFRIRNDGRGPLAPLVFGLHSWLYGTTFQGGRANLGTVFQQAP